MQLGFITISVSVSVVGLVLPCKSDVPDDSGGVVWSCVMWWERVRSQTDSIIYHRQHIVHDDLVVLELEEEEEDGWKDQGAVRYGVRYRPPRS